MMRNTLPQLASNDLFGGLLGCKPFSSNSVPQKNNSGADHNSSRIRNQIACATMVYTTDTFGEFHEYAIARQAAAAHTNPDPRDMLNCPLVMMKNNANSTRCP